MKNLISLLMAVILLFGVGAETFAAYEGDKARTYESADCTITYNIANEWSGNQQVSVSITNNSEETLRNWAIKLDSTGTVTNIWNATVLKNDGELCVIRNNGYNYEIIPGATVEFGFMQQGEDLRLPENISICSRTADSTESAEISYEIQNNWGVGFIAAVTIKNVSDEPLEAWKLHFNGNFEIVSLWNGNLLHTDDSSFKVENDITTTPIDIGGTKTFSFEGKIAAGEELTMTDFTLTSIVINMDEEELEEPDETVETADSTTSETGEATTDESTETSELNTEETTDTKESETTETVETADVSTMETGETSETDETTETSEPTETEKAIILCFGEYLAEENVVEVYWYSNVEGAVSVYENADNGGWMKLAEVVDEDSYKIAITEDFLVKQIKVKQETENGIIESEPFLLVYTEDGYVCTWLDTDEDGLPDYAEEIYGTDPENPDTDSDGLSDYDEIYTVGTSPLKYDTDEDGTNDADSDLDKDGLTNAQELELGTSPSSEDTDGDTLSDYAELNETNTDPLKADTDGDTLSDSDDIALGLDPNNPETFGVPDAEYKVDQTISADSEVMERVNTDEAPYELSLEITASGNAATNLIAGSSVYSTITESDARLGGAVDLSYLSGEVDKVKLVYEVGESYVPNEGSEYAANCVDLQGIKRYNIFRYFEDVNMLLPVATEFDVENNTLYAETDELGTYCVLDMEVLLQNLGVAPDGTQTETVMQEFNSAAVASTSDATEYYVTFIVDVRKNAMATADLASIKNEIAAFADAAFSEGRNVSIRLLTQGALDFTDSTDTYTETQLAAYTYTNTADLNNALIKLRIDDKESDFGDHYELTDVLGEVIAVSDSVANNYIVNVFSQTDAIYDKTIAVELLETVKDKKLDVSVVTEFTGIIKGFQTEIVRDSNGIIANSFSDFARRVYDHIFDPIIPDTSMNAILITGYEPIVLKGELSAINDIDTDVDGLTDWDEVDVEHWVDAGLITYNDDNTIKLPTVEQCMLHAEKSYVVDALDRLQQEYGINFGVAIGSKLVMPISSDPTHEDGDGDGYADGSIDVLGNGKINDPWPLKNNVHVYRLNNENSFVNIYDGTTTYYGGAQGWFSSDIKRDGGCGVVATANAFAYLSQQSKCQALYGYPDLSKASFSNYMEDISNYVEVLSIMGYSLGVWPCEKLIDGAVEYANTQGVPIQGSYIDGVFINRAVNDRATLIPNIVDMLMDNFPTFQSHKALVYAVADHIVKQASELLDLSDLTPEDEEENLEKAQTFIAEALEQDIPVLSLSFVNSSLKGITTFDLNGNPKYDNTFQQHWVTITEMVVDDIQNTSTIKVSSWGRYAYLSLEDVVNNEMVYNAFAYFY